MRTQPIGPFLGVNNRRPDFALHVNEQGDFLRSADNVIVSNTGSLELRPADLLVQAMTAPHSWHAVNDTTGYLVRAGVMYAVDLTSGYSETLFKLLSNDNPVSWLAFGDDLYWSNGTDSGRILAGVNYPWGLPTPDIPNVSSTAGTLHAGKYQVALSYSNATTGEEGGVSGSDNIELSATGGISVPLPTASVDGATHLNVYVSTVNGSIPFWQTSVAIGTSSVTITTVTTAHREAMQRYEEPLPAGTGLFESNGRMCCIVGKRVYYSLPWRQGYYLPADGYIDFTADVSLGVCNQGGTFVCADKTRWFPGDIAAPEDKIVDVLPYGAVPGTAFWSPNKSLVGWFGFEGIVLSTPNGEVHAVMSDNIKLTPPTSGYAALLLSDELRKVVSCGWCLNLDNLAATTYSGYDYTSTSGNYGTKADGFYQLEAAGSVAWSINFGKINFGAENLKHLPAVYAGYAADTTISLTVALPDGDSYDYDALGCSDSITVQRFDTGRGLRANWFGLSMTGTNTNLTIASVSFAPVASKRRI